MFILSEQRDADDFAAFKRYEAYLERNRTRFPPSAYSLATSDWYFGFSDHRAPHDARLESLSLEEAASGRRSEPRISRLTLRLCACHSGSIEFRYPKVYAYKLAGIDVDAGHRDWRYDELRLDTEGRLVHEIEWWDARETGRWLIFASDVEHKWIP